MSIVKRQFQIVKNIVNSLRQKQSKKRWKKGLNLRTSHMSIESLITSRLEDFSQWIWKSITFENSRLRVLFYPWCAGFRLARWEKVFKISSFFDDKLYWTFIVGKMFFGILKKFKSKFKNFKIIPKLFFSKI